MKKIFLSISMLFVVGVVNLPAEIVTLTKEKVDHTSTAPGGNKSPELPWFVDVTDNIITMSATPCDYTLNLYDENGFLVYSVFVPAGTMQVILPTTLTGAFELHFETDTYYYYGFISL